MMRHRYLFKFGVSPHDATEAQLAVTVASTAFEYAKEKAQAEARAFGVPCDAGSYSMEYLGPTDGPEQTEVVNSKYVGRVVTTRTDLDVSYEYAKNLARRVWQQHYQDESLSWEPLSDTYGVLTQLDNMLTGLTRVKPMAVIPGEADVGLGPAQPDPRTDGRGVDDRYALFEDGRGWVNLFYDERSGRVRAGSIYKSHRLAQETADRTGTGYRNVPVLLTWDRKRAVANRGKYYPDANGQYTRPHWQSQYEENHKQAQRDCDQWSMAQLRQLSGQRARELDHELKYAQERLDGEAKLQANGFYERHPELRATWSRIPKEQQEKLKAQLLSWLKSQLPNHLGREQVYISQSDNETKVCVSFSSSRWSELVVTLRRLLTERGYHGFHGAGSTTWIRFVQLEACLAGAERYGRGS